MFVLSLKNGFSTLQTMSCCPTHNAITGNYHYYYFLFQIKQNINTVQITITLINL